MKYKLYFHYDGKGIFIRMGKMIETSENTGVQLHVNKDINFA